MALLEVYDRARRSSNRSRYVCATPFDVSGAFGHESHLRLMRALETSEVDGFLRRIPRCWLSEHALQVRMRTTKGVVLSSVYRISRCPPQGGVLSPLLWVLAEERMRLNLPASDFVDVIYPVEVTTVISADALEILVWLARQNMEITKRLLKLRGLQVNGAKTRNLTLNKALFLWGIFRRAPTGAVSECCPL